MDPMYCTAFASLREMAGEISLEDILLELRRFYRATLDESDGQTCPDYHWICDTSLRALDAALWRLETAEVSDEEK